MYYVLAYPGGDADFGDHATARAVEAALSATVHALPPALEPPRRGRELWELLRRRWCELTAPWRELIAAGTSWRELLQDLELRLDLDLGSDDDSEDREYVRGLFEAEYAEAMSYATRGMIEPSAAVGRAGRLR